MSNAGNETAPRQRPVFAASFARAPVVSGLALADYDQNAAAAAQGRVRLRRRRPLEYLAGYQGSVRNLAALDEAAAGIGIISFPPGRDGIVREIPLVSRYERNLYPALAMELLRVAQGASTLLIRSTGAHGELDTGDPGMVAVKNGNYEVPSGPGRPIWIYYADTPAAAVVPVSRDVAGATIPSVADMVAGRIVLDRHIGDRSARYRLDAAQRGRARRAGACRDHRSDRRAARSSAGPDWALGAEIAVAALFCADRPGLPAVAALNLQRAGGGGRDGRRHRRRLAGFDWYNLLLSPILPVQCSLIAYAVGSGVRLLLSEGERRYHPRVPSRHYLAPSMVQQLMDNPQASISAARTARSPAVLRHSRLHQHVGSGWDRTN